MALRLRGPLLPSRRLIQTALLPSAAALPSHQPARTPTSLLANRHCPQTQKLRHQQIRPFLTSLPGLPPSGPKTVHTSRTLPYPPPQIYTLISDIDAYSSFLPHCSSSRVTHWTTATTAPPIPGTKNGNPAIADLTVSFGPLSQTYTSRVYCVHPQTVEAISGPSATTTIPPHILAQAGYDPATLATQDAQRVRDARSTGSVFNRLITRWTLEPVAAGGGKTTTHTRVTLAIEFELADPIMGFAVGQVVDSVMREMVGAFEERARQLYGGGAVGRTGTEMLGRG